MVQKHYDSYGFHIMSVLTLPLEVKNATNESQIGASSEEIWN